MPENPLPVPPPIGGAPKIVVKLAPMTGTAVKSETLRITLPPRSDSGMKSPAPLNIKPLPPTVPLAPKAPAVSGLANAPTVPLPKLPLAPAAPAAGPEQEEVQKTLKIGIAPSHPTPPPTASLIPPKLQTAQIPVIAPKPLPSAPIPKAITEAIPLGGMPPRPAPKPVSSPLPPKPMAPPSVAVKPESPKLSDLSTDTKAINLATPQAVLPTPGMTPQGPASIPPKVAVPGTAPRPSPAPLPPKPAALGAKATPAGKTPPSASGAPLSTSGGPALAMPKSVSSEKPAVTSPSPAPLKAVVSQDREEAEEPSLLTSILAVFAALLATGVAVYLFLAMSKYVAS